MFFPGAEFPSPALEATLAALGVFCRRLPIEADAAGLLNPRNKPEVISGEPAHEHLTKGARRQAPAPREGQAVLRRSRPRSARAAAGAPAGGLGGHVGGPAPGDDMAAFAMKVAALILSRFEEVNVTAG